MRSHVARPAYMPDMVARGSKGERGEPGPKGDKGDKGDPGDSGGGGGAVASVVGQVGAVTGAQIVADSTVAAALAAKADAAATTAALAVKADAAATSAALAGKAGTSHGHVVADTTGLQAALDGKAATAHAHSAADVTSGTLPLARGGTGGTDAATARTALGLGSAAVVNTGTASGDVPVLGAGGVLPVARLATGTPTGSKFVRDDGTLATPSGGGTSPFPAGPSVWRLSLPTGIGPSPFTFAVNDLRAVPIDLNAGTIDRVGVYVYNSGVAGSTVRIGMYLDTGKSYPGALLADFGVLDTSSGGTKLLTVSQVVSAGRYWLVGVCQGAAAMLETVQNVYDSRVPTSSTYNAYTDRGNGTALIGGTVSGALPANFTSTMDGVNVGPAFRLRYAS